MKPVTEQQVLEGMRNICMALPETREVISHGHPSFSNGKGIYAVLEEYGGHLSLCVKVGPEMQGVFLKDSRFYRTPYIGNQGWVSLKVHAAPLDWEEIGELLAGSYQLIGPGKKKLAATKKAVAVKSVAKKKTARSAKYANGE